MASVIFAEQTLSDFALNESVGFYMSGRGSQFELMAGKTYRVIWDNEEYICTAYEGSYLGMTYTTVYLGNESYVTGQNTEIVEPFVIYYISDNDYNAFVSVSTETSHVIAIYEVDESEEDNTEDEVSKGCRIILYDRTGAAVTYENVETITTDTPDSGVQAVFTHGEVMQGVEVELALAEGDQTLSVPEGYLVKEAVIKKPETLLPENIRKDVSIGGVTGTLIGTGVEKTVDLNMADGDQVVEADEETLMSRVIISKPETLVPENIAKGVEIGGVTGSANITEFDITDENIKKYGYQFDDENKQIIICAILNSVLYSANGNYAVTIPDKIGGYDVVLRSAT